MHLASGAGMIAGMFSVLFSSAAVAAQAGAGPPPPPPPFSHVPPPIVAESSGPSLAIYVPGLVRCGGELVAFAEAPAPFAAPWFGGNATAARPIAFTFRIGSDGRPLGIVREPGTGYAPPAPDLAPALAAAIFPAGAGQAHCRMAFTIRVETAASASFADVARYTVFPQGPPQRGFFDRLRPPGSTCVSGPPPLLRAFPDFRRVPQRSGTVAHALVGFDVDRRGRPVRVTIADSSGNAVLDRASLAAVARSRFVPGARQGCLFPYWRRADVPLAAPDIPDDPAYRDASTCPSEGWVRPPALMFPDNWRRRGIEGWAVIRYDLAPWGEPGNMTVLAAEPSDEFGTAALAMLRATRKAPSTAVRIGCVARVRYKMGRPDEIESDTPPF